MENRSGGSAPRTTASRLTQGGLPPLDRLDLGALLFALAFFLLPAIHPLFRPAVGAVSHLLWWVHVLPVGRITYAAGLRGALLALATSAALAAAGEATFGAGYGRPADRATVVAIVVALGATNLLVALFALQVRREKDWSGRLFGQLGMPMMLFDAASGAVLRANRALGRLHGGPPEGMTVRELFHGELPAAEEDGAEAELALRTTAGGEVPVRLTLHPAPAVGPHRHLAVVTDLSERRSVEREHRRSIEQLRALFEQSPVGIALSVDGRIRRANPTLVRMLGYRDAGELEGQPIVRFIAAAERPRVEDTHRRRQRGDRVPASYETTGLRADGSSFPILIQASRVPLGDELLNIAFLTDLSERQSLEEQLRQAQKLEAVGQLAGGVAHDFNNLLTVIGGSAQLLLAGTAGDDRQRMDLEQILAATERAAKLTQQLLAFSRRQVLLPRIVDLNQVVRDLEKMLRRIIGEDVALVIELASSPATVRIDPGKLEQVIMNLVVNARDAMPDGGALRIATAAVPADPYASGDPVAGIAVSGDQVTLTVADTGTGMDDATRQRIFEPFFTTKETGRGSGLGLSVVYGIVHQSGGTIEVASEPGRGTRFTIRLPAADAAAEPNAVEAAAVAGGRETILLVEDDAGVRSLVHRMLASFGYRVIEAEDPLVALQQLRGSGRRVDLLLTDVVLPGMTGRELAELLIRERLAARAVFMSGYSEEVLSRRGELEPGVQLLEKPFTPARLSLAVRRALDGDPPLRPPRGDAPPS